MKVIFLDIDGVLNSQEWYTERMEKESSYDYPFDEFSPELVRRFNKIIEKSKADIVVSSTWRIGRSLPELRDLFRFVGIKGNVIGKTSSNEFRGDYVRGKEIKQWLEEQREEIQYVIIDDDNDMLPEQQEHFIKTTWMYGIEEKHEIEVIKKLNNDDNREI